MSAFDHLDRVEMGKYIRAIRGEKGYKIGNLMEKGLSAATISNIERGVVTVSQASIETYCQKLNIDMEKMFESIQKIDTEFELKQAKLRAIESIIVHAKNGAKKGLKMLDELSLSKTDPLFPTAQYIRGKCLIRLQSWFKAKTALQQAIRAIGLNPDWNYYNIESSTYYELGRSYFYENEYEQALTQIEMGTNAFVKNDGREFTQYNLPILKVFCLEKLERHGEALKTLVEVWQYMDQIDDMRLIVNMYDKRASLLIKMNLHNEAIDFVLEGIEKARRNELTDRAFELWISAGQIYDYLGQYSDAMIAINSALEMREAITNSSLLIDAYTELGRIKLRNDHISEAIKQLKVAVKYGSRRKDETRLIQTHIALADCYVYKLDLDNALSHYQTALETIKTRKMTIQERDLTWKICYCIEQMDHTGIHKKYLQNMHKHLVSLMHDLEGGVKLEDK
ncbi:hypothetical protein IC620_13765 [Hazenella sp. IB182357]|uniref:HTH cro/C1-type domain-containing protein n=1 Tax=Polycladospora coralii TaxID=2771432 RepID=A0A926NBB0_9BACL|nr:helix-turn-helix transcriptional regulator [Polycladospora coralii]MBD1373417.1 hypothetical protein [Polycladospora coralii]